MTLLPAWVLSAISDGEGNTSVGRLIALLIVATCVVMPSLLWFWLSCLHSKLEDIPGSFIGFMTAAGALATGLYAITKNKEQ